ncbi:MAG: preprotein translocase subunit YajC [Clostridiales bacterium]|nr:preprotein translocase subunit YajC [Clostridiales bacterium]
MDTTSIVLLVLIVVLVVAYPILVSSKNKKERQRFQEMTNSLKRGDKVLTASGVYGTIVDLHKEDDKTIVTIETGMGKNKGYISVDAYAIYTILPDENEQKADEDKKEESSQPAQETIENQKEEET